MQPFSFIYEKKKKEVIEQLPLYIELDLEYEQREKEEVKEEDRVCIIEII